MERRVVSLSMLVSTPVRLDHMWHRLRACKRHGFDLDFRQEELLAPWELLTGRQWWMQEAWTRSFADVVGFALRALPGVVYVTVVFGEAFQKHLGRFIARFLAVTSSSLFVMALDAETHVVCAAHMQERVGCGWGATQTTLHKYATPAILTGLGRDVAWIDFDVFLVGPDPTPYLLDLADKAGADIVLAGSLETRCMCNGIFFARATRQVQRWLVHVVEWLYNHPYDSDQKTFAALLNGSEVVDIACPLTAERIPKSAVLDPVIQFPNAATTDDNGWVGDPTEMVTFHIMAGEGDAWGGLDGGGVRRWLEEHGGLHGASGSAGILDIFYGAEEPFYHSSEWAFNIPSLREAMELSRKEFRRLDRLDEPCGPVPFQFNLVEVPR
mmetsp:Transcript_75643/g.202214  ORF Transcript_75643/g.202214 Transcript_75643/m.202214 type:complete len:383 (+) Transcript_75643:763-1911(+)